MICIGNSHMACVLVAAEEAGVHVDAVMLKRAHYFESLQRQPAAAERGSWLGDGMVRLLRKGDVFSFIGGTKHLSKGLRMHPQPFDFVLPEASHLPVEAEAEMVPFQAMRAVLQRDVERDLARVEELVRIASGQVYQFETPPPLHDEWIRGRSPGRVDEKPAASQYLRYKLWRLNTEIVREHAERTGAVFVEYPPAAVDKEGFLKPDLVENATHANAKYGALVLAQIKALS